MTPRFVLAALLVLLAPAWLSAQDKGFALKDTPGQHLDVLLDGKIAARYMYAYDKSDKARRAETCKPFLHVFDAEGQAPITKGAAGQPFPHHRGIFIGWIRIQYNGKKYDQWGTGANIVHQKFEQQEASPDRATLASLTHWNDETGKPMVEELRTMTLRRAPAPGRLLIDFKATLKAPNGEVLLDGDPEHGGVQYRPAAELDAAQTRYTFPVENPKPHADTDYPWVGITYMVGGKTHSVVEMSHRSNPKGTRWSAYRDYGRFGAFFKHTLKPGDALTVNYRFLVADGEMPSAEVIQKSADEFAGAVTATPAPRTKVLPAEKSAPPKPKAPAQPKAGAADKK